MGVDNATKLLQITIFYSTELKKGFNKYAISKEMFVYYIFYMKNSHSQLIITKEGMKPYEFHISESFRSH